MKINLTLNIPSEKDLDDFLITHGSTLGGDKEAELKGILVKFVEQSIKSKRISEITEREREEIKAVEDAVLNIS